MTARSARWRRRSGLPVTCCCRVLDRRRPRDDHGRQHHDRDGRGCRRAAAVTEGHRDEIEMRRVHKEAIWDPSYPAPHAHRPAAGPHPDPRAGGLRRRGAAAARRGCGAGRRPSAPAAGRHVGGGGVPVLVRATGPRAADPGDHPRGVPRGLPHLAVARGAAGRARVRADVDDAGERLRGAPGGAVRVATGRAAAGGRVRRAGADRAGHRRRHAARARGASGR